MEKTLRFTLAAMLAIATLAPVTGLACAAHQNRGTAAMRSGKKIAKKATPRLATASVRPTAAPAPAAK